MQAAANPQPQPQKVRRGPDVENVSSAAYIRSPDALLVRGTYLRCVLETRIITDVAGYTSCLLTEPVYSINGRNLLLPKGSKIYGSYGGGPIGKRVEVIWDRITTPNGIDVAMSSPGTDGLGGAGHPGQYSAHWGSRIASALMISLIADAFKYAAAEHGPESTTVASNGFAVRSPYECNRSHHGATCQRGAQRAPPADRDHQPGHDRERLRRQGRRLHQRAAPPPVTQRTIMDAEVSPLALVSSDFLRYQYEVLGIAEYMTSPEVTEICINRPGELYLETRAGWQRVEVPSLTFERARQFCTAVVNESNTGQRITDADPVVSLTFPTGQRAQFVIPPACDAGKVSITIRLPSKHTKSLTQYHEDGFFNQILETDGSISEQDRELLELRHSREYAEFFRRAVMYRKNIVVSGATGSGKTTFMKALVNHIPDNERLVTIEDARELFLTQPNVVHLLYSKGGQSTSNVTAKSCMEACLRMKPERIILAELRGDEAFYFIRNCASGHPGSITSCHAGSPEQTWDQLALMVKASAEGSGLEFNVIKRLLMMTIDIVVHIKAHAGSRYITGIDFNPGRAQGQEG